MPIHKTLIIFLFFWNYCLAQNDSKSAFSWPKANLTIAYYGNNVSNPGLVFGYEQAFLEKTKTKAKTKKGSSVLKQKGRRLEWVPNLGFYVDPGSHTSIYGNLSIQFKNISNRLWVFHTSLGLGYNVQFLRNVYEVNNLVVSASSSTKANTYFAPVFKLGIGKINKRRKKLRAWFFAFSNQFLFDYNDAILLSPALELGYRFQ